MRDALPRNYVVTAAGLSLVTETVLLKFSSEKKNTNLSHVTLDHTTHAYIPCIVSE